MTVIVMSGDKEHEAIIKRFLTFAEDWMSEKEIGLVTKELLKLQIRKIREERRNRNRTRRSSSSHQQNIQTSQSKP